MPLARRRSAVELALPEGPSAVEVDGVEHPAMLVQRSLRPVLHARVVESLDRRRLLPCSDRGGHEHAVARDDRRTPRQPLEYRRSRRRSRSRSSAPAGSDHRERRPRQAPGTPASLPVPRPRGPQTTSSAPSATTAIRCIGSLLRPSPARARGLAPHDAWDGYGAALGRRAACAPTVRGPIRLSSSERTGRARQENEDWPLRGIEPNTLTAAHPHPAQPPGLV